MKTSKLKQLSKTYFILGKYIYPILVLLLSVWWITATSYFAFTTPIGNPPDEIYHIKLSEQYKPILSIIVNDSQDTIKLGIISKSPNLYHFILGKLLNLTTDNNNFLRTINFIMGLLFFFICVKTINQHTSSRFTRFLFLFLISNTMMLLYLYGAVSYDNFINLFAVYSFYLLFQIVKNKSFTSTNQLIIISLITILAKPTYFPLFVIQLLFILINQIKNHQIFGYVKAFLSSKIFLILLIFLSLITLYFYGNNIFKYKTISPSCNQLFSQTFCQNDPSTAQTKELVLETSLKPSFTNLYTYSTSWIRLMTERTFGVFSHKSLLPNPEWISLLTMVIAFFIIIIFKFINNKYDYYLFFISVIYIGILFFINYNGYLDTGITHVAVQGRYIFPVIFPLYYLCSKYIGKTLRNKALKLSFLLLVAYLFTKFGFFYFVRFQDVLKYLKVA